MTVNTKKFLLTGATGLVGSRLLVDLLRKNHMVYCLVRPQKNVSLAARVQRVLNFWGGKSFDKYGKNLILLRGDILEENLGLVRGDIRNLVEDVDEVIHSAAATELNSPKQFFVDTNVNGTRNVLNLALKFKHLIKVNHISTIFISGNQDGVFCEKSQNTKSEFITEYEKSKFEGEKIVQEFRTRGVWIDIFRLPAVVGDSRTGKTPTFNLAFYQGLKILTSGFFSSLPCKNIEMPVGFINELSLALIKISLQNKKRNLCFHVFNQDLLNIEKVLVLACKQLKFKVPGFVSMDDFDAQKITPVQARLLQFNYMFLNRPSIYNSENTCEYLRKIGFEFSDYNEISLSPLIKYAARKNFLKLKTDCARSRHT